MRGSALCAGLMVALLGAPVARAQVELFTVVGGQERSVPAVYNLGSFYANESGTANFRLRNTSSAPATLSVLSVSGVGFVFSRPALPATLAAGAAVEFTVTFRAADIGTYSAALLANGISVLLTAELLPRLTYRVDPTPATPFPGPLDFGGVLRATTAQVRIRIQNEANLALTVPAIAVQGEDFALLGTSPSGQTLLPTQGAEFALAFTPQTLGVKLGSLTLGDRTYTLSGTGIDPPQPKPTLVIDLKQPASAQQGTLVIRLDTASQVRTTGTVTMTFDGAADSAMAFAAGGRTVAFGIEPGDQQLALPFQTGTSAGTLTFAVDIAGNADHASVVIAPMAPAVTAVQGIRSGPTVQLRITGFDNTRSLSALAFTFYDAQGNAIAPGVIRADASRDFASYFAASDMGGVFLLNVVFPLTGDGAGLASWEAALTNSAGSSKTARNGF